MDWVTYLRCKKANRSIVGDVIQSKVSALRNINIGCLRLQIKATPQRGLTEEDQHRSIILREVLWLKDFVGVVQFEIAVLIC